MTAARVLKYITWSNGRWGMCWRHPVSRFGNDRSRRVLAQFPQYADIIARLTVEAGSRPRKAKAVRHG